MSVTLDYQLINEPKDHLTDEMIIEMEIHDLMIEFNIEYEEAKAIRTFFTKDNS